MLGAPEVFPPSVVSDARFALHRPGQRPRPPASRPVGHARVTVRARVQQVTAVCQAAHSGEVFLGFESGEVVCFRPATGELSTVTSERGAVLALAATADGDAVAVVSSLVGEGCVLKSFVKRLTFAATGVQCFGDWDGADLCRNLRGDAANYIAGFLSGEVLHFFHGPALVPLDHCDLADTNFFPEAILLLHSATPTPAGMALLAFSGPELVCLAAPAHGLPGTPSFGGGWRLGVPNGGSLTRPAVSWLEKGSGGIELAGIDRDGNLYASDVRFADEKIAGASTLARAGDVPFRAAAVLRPGVVAGVTGNGVHWLRRGSGGLRPAGSIDVALPSAVASFRHPRGNELIVVCGDGTVVRVPAPSH
jgi:hypothetical protein